MAEVRREIDIPEILPDTLPVMALRRGVLFPGAVVPFTVGRRPSLSALDGARGGLLLVGVQREPVADPAPSDLLPIATLARIIQRQQLPNGTERVLIQGLTRASIHGYPSTRPHLAARFSRVMEEWPETTEAAAMAEALVEGVKATADILSAPIQPWLDSVPHPGILADVASSLLQIDDEEKAEILLTLDPVARAERVLTHVVKARGLLEAKKSIKDRVDEQTRDMQKQFVLRQQLEAIQKELGEGGEGDDELTRLKERLAEAKLTDEARKVVDRELRRLERLGNTSPERSVAIDWLEWIADLPWQVETAVDADLTALESALEDSHYGLEDVKRQVVEHLSVRQLAGAGRADVLLLSGPPGVGKTSIAQAIADATGRKLVRMALGGVRDEAELRGHRRTYIGARPGRLVEGIRRAGTQDPVILLDEIDKLSNSHMGNPAAALLEILDPEQNHAFTDHYLEVPFDLSKALFIATANDLSQIPGPLRDRLEILQIDGYTRAEKQVIAKRHLLTKVASNAGVTVEDVDLTDGALEAVIDGWTREAGVRELQRLLGKIYRAAAVQKAKGKHEGPLSVDVGDLESFLKRRRFHDEDREDHNQPGIASGLAWTPVGGSVLTIEASTLPGNGRLVLTGQLGDVMKESARAALTYVLANADKLGVPLDAMDERDVHIHVPAGAVPKDGPSAGVTMFTALASLLSGRAVRPDVAMTGEATLRGRVLPVGGIKAKVLAAHRQGYKRIILPKKNAADVNEVPENARKDLDIVLVDAMSDVLEAALEPAVAVPADLDEEAVA
ncbi:MAG: endopeptidase La [Deltaproteobacteria bacterium]|nr:MAG: endopeptidase La [Deltaproteobacteria bacterium]